jgi:hypothetical protein
MVFIGRVRRCCGRRLGAWGLLVRPVGHATWPGGQVSSLHHLWALDTLSTASAGHVDETVFGNAPTHGRPATPWFGWARVCATSFPFVILSVTMPYFGYNEDMHGFWSIWCFSVIWCSQNGRPTKLVELISNRHLSSISWIKCRYDGGKYMHFMTAYTPTQLEFCSS